MNTCWSKCFVRDGGLICLIHLVICLGEKSLICYLWTYVIHTRVDRRKRAVTWNNSSAASIWKKWWISLKCEQRKGQFLKSTKCSFSKGEEKLHTTWNMTSSQCLKITQKSLILLHYELWIFAALANFRIFWWIFFLGWKLKWDIFWWFSTILKSL